MQETQVQLLSQEDPLEKRMATHSCMLAWRIPWTEEPDELQSIRLERVRQDSATKTNTLFVVSLEIPTTSHLKGKRINLASKVP